MRKMKRFASFALAACMGASLLATGPVTKVSAAEPDAVVTAEATDTDAEILDETQEVVYDESEVDEDGFTWDGTTIVKYDGNGGTVKIPEKCMSIGDYAFAYCDGLTSIEIPMSVTSIGNRAFFNCYHLKDIEIPTSVTSIGDWAFKNCDGLASIEIPTSVTSIGDWAFWDCNGLTSIEIPASVKSIGNRAFGGCNRLSSISVSSKNVTYNSNGNCNAIIETKTNKLIQGCKNTKIPGNITSINEGAFEFCDGLASIEIPASVTSIAYSAFGNSGLKTIYGTSGTCAETYAKEHGYQFIERVAVPTVTNVQAAAAGKNKVKVTWDKVSGATGYIVYARKNGTYAKLGVTAATSYTDTKALDNDYNFYFVYAYKKTVAGNIFTGKCQKYAYAKGTCMAVTNLKASSVKGGVKLTWTKSDGADGYIVYGKKTDFKYGYIGMTTKNTATSYTDTKANKGSYNFYWVFPYHYDKNGNRVIGPICGYVYGKAK